MRELEVRSIEQLHRVIAVDFRQLAGVLGERDANIAINREIVRGDRRLNASDEVVLFPRSAEVEMILVQTKPIDPSALLSAFTRNADRAGAVVIFTGITHSQNAGEPIVQLYLDCYPGFTEKMIATIEDESRNRFDISGVLIVHRHGSIRPGEPIVFVATATKRRRSAFEAAD